MAARLTSALAAGLALVVVVVILITSGGPAPHTLRAAFGSAINVVPGQEVRVGGVKVGEVQSVSEADGQAVLTLKIDNGAVWPLHQGTIARLRYGTTVSYAARYVELFPGPATAPALASGGVLSTSDTITPVEFDQIFNIYNSETRGNLRGLISNGQLALQSQAADLAGALQNSPGAFDQLAGVMREFGADRTALATLAQQGARATSALAAQDGPLQAWLEHFAGTFDELASHASEQQASLDRMPATFATLRATLHRLDTSLTGLDSLITDLRPGASGLATLAGPLSGALGELRTVAPLATRTLDTGANAAPAITALLAKGTSFMPNLGAVLGQLAPAFGCIRPYTPEIAGALATWDGFAKNYDSIAHYARTLLQTLPYSAAESNSQQVLKDAPGTSYAFPRPPGLSAGQTWLQPQCDAGPSALNAALDPEAPR